MPAKALENPNWGLDAPKKKRGRPKTSCKPSAPSTKFQWLLEDDIDVKIDARIDDIRDTEDIDFNNNNDVYFSCEDGEGSEIPGDESNAENFWPPELLYAPCSSCQKRQCKQKLMTSIIYENRTYISLETREERKMAINAQHCTHNVTQREGDGRCGHGEVSNGGGRLGECTVQGESEDCASQPVDLASYIG